MLPVMLAGVFIAFGAVCLVWVLAGLLLPHSADAELICRGSREEVMKLLPWLLWLRSVGLLKLPLRVQSRLQPEDLLLLEKYGIDLEQHCID